VRLDAVRLQIDGQLVAPLHSTVPKELQACTKAGGNGIYVGNVPTGDSQVTCLSTASLRRRGLQPHRRVYFRKK